MPIRIHPDLPAYTILAREKVFVMDIARAEKQDIRELKIIILNLMPKKIETETQLLRLLSNTPLQIDIDFLTTESYRPKNTSEQHLFKFYRTIKDIEDKRYDGMIITGAPLEHINFKEVAYWEEIMKIFAWASKNVTSTMFICWAAQAALYYHYGIESQRGIRKYSGIFEYTIENTESPIIRGFDDSFHVPVSRYVKIERNDILKEPSLKILSDSKDPGVYLISSRDKKQLFVANHPEYEKNTLKQEYLRDLAANSSPEIPRNYFKEENSGLEPEVKIVKWRSHANLLFSNWINYYVYQETEYDLDIQSRETSILD